MGQEMLKCPIEGHRDEDMPLGIVFDTFSVGMEQAESLAKLVSWLSEASSRAPALANAALHALHARLGDRGMALFRARYCMTYDRKERRLMRFHPVGSKEAVAEMFDMVSAVHMAMPDIANAISSRFP